MDDIRLLTNYVNNVNDFRELYDIPWKLFYDKNKKCREGCSDIVKVLILNNPCMGFGDIVFAMSIFEIGMVAM